jgi:hypothetical protein
MDTLETYQHAMVERSGLRGEGKHKEEEAVAASEEQQAGKQ